MSVEHKIICPRIGKQTQDEQNKRENQQIFQTSMIGKCTYLENDHENFKDKYETVRY